MSTQAMRMFGKYVSKDDPALRLKKVLNEHLSDPQIREREGDTPLYKAVHKSLLSLDTANGLRWRSGAVNKFNGARMRKPQRVVQLTVQQERDRWQQTLSNYDRLIYDCLRQERLGTRIVEDQKESFVANASDMVVCHCDQVPMWLRLGTMRQLVSVDELQGIKRPDRQKSQSQKAVSEHADGMTQIRQATCSEGDRFRVTLELSQYVHNVFKPGVRPEVRHGRPVLVVYGAHCRLSNISEEGKWFQAENFMAGGKRTVRKRGGSAGTFMKTWRKLRASGKYHHFLTRSRLCSSPQHSATG